MEILQLNDLMPIGRFKNHPIKMLLGISEDERFSGIGQEKYLKWFDETVKQYSLSGEIKTILKRRLTKISEEAYKAESKWKNKQWQLGLRDGNSKKKSSYNRVNQNVWNAGGMNTDYQEHGISVQDMGYDGDGW